MERDAKIYVAGHAGLVGSAVMRLLYQNGFENIITAPFEYLDLRNQAEVEAFFWTHRPDYVIVAAARVGGIHANATYPAQFLYDNLMIASNCIHAAFQHGVRKLLFLGSSCIYPRKCLQPMQETALLTGPFELTNEAYALAKIGGIKLCQFYREQYGCNFISCLPTNLYGPGDTFDALNGHVIPALITKIYKAQQNNEKEVIIWGSGKVRREFLYVDDCARALITLLHNYESSEPLNIGYGSDYSIAEVAQLIKEIIGYTGTLIFDTQALEGVSQKLLDSSRIVQYGWQPTITLEEGIRRTVEWYKAHSDNHYIAATRSEQGMSL